MQIQTGSDAGGAEPNTTLYQRVGGTPYFNALVERFYTYVAEDAVLRPLYPEDLEPSKAHLAAFLVQLWGGPPQFEWELVPEEQRPTVGSASISATGSRDLRVSWHGGVG